MPHFFDILVEHNVGIKMKDFFVEQLSLKQNAESFKHALNQNEFKQNEQNESGKISMQFSCRVKYFKRLIADFVSFYSKVNSAQHS